MIYWIKKIAMLSGMAVFFMVFVFSLMGGREYTLESLSLSLVRAVVGASLAWVVGIVIADILLKGVLCDIENDRKVLLEGGLLQRMQSLREAAVPGGSDMPFSEVVVARKPGAGGGK